MVVCLVWIQEIVGSIPTTPTQVQRNVAYWDGAWFGTKSVSRGSSILPIPTREGRSPGKALTSTKYGVQGLLT